MGWLTLALLGAYHGLNPGRGWLFAVALGMQERSTAAIVRALPAIALGHALSVALVVAAVAGAQRFVPLDAMRAIGATALLAFAVYLAVRRHAHPRWVGMRVGFRDLALWSFLTSSAHGAGLMLLPVLTGAGASGHAGHAAHAGGATPTLALGVHTAAMLIAMTAAAVVVFRVAGLALLRRAWVNLDAIWVGALVVAAVATLVWR